MQQWETQQAPTPVVPVVFAAVAVALVFVAVYYGAASLRIDSYLARADSIDERLADASEALDEEAAAFQVSPAVAERVALELRPWIAEFEALHAEALVLDAPTPALLFPDQVEPHEDAIVLHLDATTEYAGLLLASSEFAIGREEAFDEIVDVLDGLQALSGEGIEADEAARAVSTIREDLEAAVGRMRAEPPSVPVLYSNTHVLWRLDQISDRLKDVEDSIIALDDERIEESLESYAELVGADWASFLTAHDHGGQQSLYSAAYSVRDAAERSASAREDVVSLRERYLLVVLVCSAAALFCGLAFLMLRSGRT